MISFYSSMQNLYPPRLTMLLSAVPPVLIPLELCLTSTGIVLLDRLAGENR